MPKGNRKVLKAQKTIFLSRHGLCNILFLSLGELGICLQNLIPIGGVDEIIHVPKIYKILYSIMVNFDF
jgi:hypothetical protein